VERRSNDEIYESDADDLDSDEVMIYYRGFGPSREGIRADQYEPHEDEDEED
jgi:hypothetical protein